jgi:hypothetical protein
MSDDAPYTWLMVATWACLSLWAIAPWLCVAAVAALVIWTAVKWVERDVWRFR